MSLTTNLNAYWKLDESSGDAADATANANTLTNTGTCTYATAVINNGVTMSTTAKYLSRASTASLSITGDMTISGWFKPSALPGSNAATYVIAKDDFSTNRSYDFILYNDVAGGHGQGIRMYIFADGGSTNYVYVQWDYTLSTSVFTYLTVVITPANSIGTKMELFVNGVSQGNGSANFTSGTGATSIYNGTGPFYIGTASYTGSVDETGVWARTLSSSEVSQLYNGGAGLAYPFTIPTSIKTINGLAQASVKTVDGLAIASVKSIDGLT